MEEEFRLPPISRRGRVLKKTFKMRLMEQEMEMADPETVVDFPFEKSQNPLTIGATPIDAAAHLKLLGDSLTALGEKLGMTDCQPAAIGVYSVLLDSLLCSMVPLLCLTRGIAGMEHLPEDVFKKMLDHIAYFLPGL